MEVKARLLCRRVKNVLQWTQPDTFAQPETEASPHSLHTHKTFAPWIGQCTRNLKGFNSWNTFSVPHHSISFKMQSIQQLLNPFSYQGHSDHSQANTENGSKSELEKMKAQAEEEALQKYSRSHHRPCTNVQHTQSSTNRRELRQTLNGVGAKGLVGEQRKVTLFGFDTSYSNRKQQSTCYSTFGNMQYY